MKKISTKKANMWSDDVKLLDDAKLLQEDCYLREKNVACSKHEEIRISEIFYLHGKNY